MKKLKLKILEQQFQIELKSRLQILHDMRLSQEGIINTPLSFWCGNIIGMI